MSSAPPSKVLELPLLEQRFLAACQDNDIDRLGQLNALLSRFEHVLKQASLSSANSFSKDKATFLSVFSHDVDVASSLAEKVELDIEQITNRFTQQLGLITLPASPMAPLSQDLAPVQSGSSVPNLVLKQWSQSHMSCLFPSKEELEELASRTSTSQNQINLWFRNARTRSGWSKLFAHPRVNKDHRRLKTLLVEYDSIILHSSPERFKSSLTRNEPLHLLDQVLRWFATTKPVKPSKIDSVTPWVKEVLNNSLANLKGNIHPCRQLLPSLSSKKRARTRKSPPSAPSPLPQFSTPIAGPSSTPSLSSESSCSSLSPQPTPVGESSRFSSSLSHEPLCPGNPSGPVSTTRHLLHTSPVLCSLPGTCTPVRFLSSPGPMLKTPEFPMPTFNSEPAPDVPNAISSTRTLITTLTTSGPDPSTESGQFEDADEA